MWAKPFGGTGENTFKKAISGKVIRAIESSGKKQRKKWIRKSFELFQRNKL